MTDRHPDGTPHRLGPTELDGVSGLGEDDLAAELRVARELESLAAGSPVTPSAAFTDRVMAAVADEPSPVPMRAAGSALRHAAPGAFLAAIRDAWRVMTRPGFPMAVRAPAMALVLVVVVLGGGTAAAAAGALGLLDGDRSGPGPSPSVVAPEGSLPPSVAPPSPSVDALSPSPDPRLSPPPSEDPGASDGESEEPSASGEDDDATSRTGSGGGSGSGSDETSSRSGSDGSGSGSDDHATDPDDTPATETPHPDETPRATGTPTPSQTPEATHSDGGTSEAAGPPDD